MKTVWKISGVLAISLVLAGCGASRLLGGMGLGSSSPAPQAPVVQTGNNLALPPEISSLLDPPLKSLGYDLQPAKDLDMSSKEFTFHRARNGAGKPLTLAYVQSLENRECAETITMLGFLLRKQKGPLIVFSGGQHVDSVYTDDVTELWESLGFDYVRL